MIPLIRRGNTVSCLIPGDETPYVFHVQGTIPDHAIRIGRWEKEGRSIWVEDRTVQVDSIYKACRHPCTRTWDLLEDQHEEGSPWDLILLVTVEGTAYLCDPWAEVGKVWEHLETEVCSVEYFDPLMVEVGDELEVLLDMGFKHPTGVKEVVLDRDPPLVCPPKKPLPSKVQIVGVFLVRETTDQEKANLGRWDNFYVVEHCHGGLVPLVQGGYGAKEFFRTRTAAERHANLAYSKLHPLKWVS